MAGLIIQGRFLSGQPKLKHCAPPPSAARVVLPAGVAAHQLPFGFLRTGQPGRPLPPMLREQMESFFGQDFSAVRIHVGPAAASIGSLAFTVGADIHMAPGQYTPDSIQGKLLLGHELTHVVQQRQGRVRNPYGSGTALVVDPRLEAEADRLGQQAAHHRPSPKPVTIAMPRMMRGGEITPAPATCSPKSPITPILQPIKNPALKKKSKKVIPRKDFNSFTKNAIPLPKGAGEHRRHIIANHTLRYALEAWATWNDNKRRGSVNMTYLKNLLEKMNNYLPNLIPGPGSYNTAIGMISNRLEKKLDKDNKKKGSKQDLKSNIDILRDNSGFMKNTQKELQEPMINFLETSVKNPDVSNNFIEDVHYSTNFDWPGGSETQFISWRTVYLRFEDLRKSPGKFTKIQLKNLCKRFMALPRPSGEHRSGRRNPGR